MIEQNVFKGITQSQRDLVEYWASLRDGSGRVSRENLDPGHFRSMLASISIVEVSPRGEFRFRIAGSKLRELFGREARGHSVQEISGKYSESYLLGLSAALERTVPVGGMIENAARGKVHAWLRLPLLGNDGRVSQVLCHDTLLSPRRALLESAGQHTGLSNDGSRAAA